MALLEDDFLNEDGAGAISESGRQSIRGSVVWMKVAAIFSLVILIAGGLAQVFLMFQLLSGGFGPGGPSGIWAGFGMVYILGMIAVGCWTCVQLLNYSSHLSAYSQNSQEEDVILAFKKHRELWKFAGIFMILWFVFLALMIIFLLAWASSF